MKFPSAHGRNVLDRLEREGFPPVFAQMPPHRAKTYEQLRTAVQFGFHHDPHIRALMLSMIDLLAVDETRHLVVGKSRVDVTTLEKQSKRWWRR